LLSQSEHAVYFVKNSHWEIPKLTYSSTSSFTFYFYLVILRVKVFSNFLINAHILHATAIFEAIPSETTQGMPK